MKAGLFAVLLISFLSGGLRTISRINEYAQEAAQAYHQQNYTNAIAAYEYLLHDLEVNDDQLRLNLAHAYYEAGLMEQAKEAYRLLADHPTSHLRAVVHLQLGNIAARQQKYKQALSLYRQALIADPASETARYDYELLKKYLELHPEKAEQATEEKLPPKAQEDSLQAPPPSDEQLEPQPGKKEDAQGNETAETDKQEPSDRSTDQQQPEGGEPEDSSGNDAGDKNREEAGGTAPGDTKGQSLEDAPLSGQSPLHGSSENASGQDQRAQTQRIRLQQMNMSPEKAKLLLDAMRNAELQYIQQLPKKSARKPDPGKPDW
ncbi:tetratricopeptide repeat protein [Pontibacter sp. 172403-2]|uniref:tetratricopeptide repeat protein n=1 Tax=Pontibacter rufus TaxID=2791028 RepID=UPI0018AFB96B|nr:tetratricopeptide repeat protein [Pontibacter sp. 172403-2]MBF9252587.1 tetratricopeptide repeat protein [Pontibacter sp. 172403-2]